MVKSKIIGISIVLREDLFFKSSKESVVKYSVIVRHPVVVGHALKRHRRALKVSSITKRNLFVRYFSQQVPRYQDSALM